LEHPHLITIGKTGSNQDIKISSKIISDAGIKIIRTNRGGKVTYHGPGQMITYPIINLRRLKLGPQEYIFKIEDTIIKTLSEFGVSSNRSAGNPGVWVQEAKIAAVGVRISEGVSTHGFSINLNPNLSYFDFIVPCGVPDKSVCSLNSLGIKTIDSNHFKNILFRNFADIFNLTIKTCSLDEIHHLYNIKPNITCT
jgi:lipoate-protein ligase B